MKNASDFGFAPWQTADKNTQALQNAVKGGGTVYVTEAGDYKLGGTVVLESHTELIFGAGVRIHRTDENNEGLCYTFINEGAFTRIYDTDIKIIGLNLYCDGVDVRSVKNYIPGLRGHISFFYIKNLTVRDFFCPDLLTSGFCIHVCTFENILLENLRIEGKKDAVHLGRGKFFTIRNGHFRTFDDPVALNAHDYATSNPQLGWIENGIIENCRDLDQPETTGFFCRILAGSWGDWKRGMSVQHSDTVVCNGRLYRVIMKPDGQSYTSLTPPSHESGSAEHDGINWVMVQDDVIYNCGCRNIRFKDIYLCKKRHTAFSIHFDDDRWSRSVYPDSEMPIQHNLIFENICFENKVDRFISTVSPVDNIKIVNSDIDEAYLEFTSLPRDGLVYPDTTLTLIGTSIKSSDGELIRCAQNRHIKLCTSVCDIAGELRVSKNVKKC